MKKIFGIIAVSAFLFASCGNTNNTEATEEVTEPATEEIVAAEETTTEECTEATEECTEATEEVAEVFADSKNMSTFASSN